jgi:hypothetical protein
MRSENEVWKHTKLRSSKYLNNLIDQDHRGIKSRTGSMLGFKRFDYAAVTHAPLMAAFMTVELTGQWSLFPFVLLSSIVTWIIARSLSPHSLYAIATPEPADDIGDHGGSIGRSFGQHEPLHAMEVAGADESRL